jgi:Potential Monad-binding region of RPAP3
MKTRERSSELGVRFTQQSCLARATCGGAGTEFEAAWRLVRGDSALQTALLRRMDPAALPALFKHSLTPALLGGVARAALCQLAAGDDAPFWTALLEGLTRVPRFEVVALSLGGAEKSALSTLWDAAAAGAADPTVVGKVAAMKATYRL